MAMTGHNETKAKAAVLKLRIEPALKKRITELAERQRKTPSQLMREMLWQKVDQDEKTGGQEELPLIGTEHHR